jgi:hypothetical protein
MMLRVMTGAVAMVAGLVVGTPAASADTIVSVSACKQKDHLFSKTITGAKLSGLLRRNCTVRYASGSRIAGRDYLAISTKDTKCDNYGPNFMSGAWFEAKNNNGCRGAWKTTKAATGHSPGRKFQYILQTRNGKKIGATTGFVNFG